MLRLAVEEEPEVVDVASLDWFRQRQETGWSHERQLADRLDAEARAGDADHVEAVGATVDDDVAAVPADPDEGFAERPGDLGGALRLLEDGVDRGRAEELPRRRLPGHTDRIAGEVGHDGHIAMERAEAGADVDVGPAVAQERAVLPDPSCRVEVGGAGPSWLRSGRTLGLGPATPALRGLAKASRGQGFGGQCRSGLGSCDDVPDSAHASGGRACLRGFAHAAPLPLKNMEPSFKLVRPCTPLDRPAHVIHDSED